MAATMEICTSCREAILPDDLEWVVPRFGLREDRPYHRLCVPSTRKLTRQERLEAAADAGKDTWEEYREEV